MTSTEQTSTVWDTERMHARVIALEGARMTCGTITGRAVFGFNDNARRVQITTPAGRSSWHWSANVTLDPTA